MIVRIPKFPQIPRGEVPSVPPHVGMYMITFVICPVCAKSDRFVFVKELSAWCCVECNYSVPTEAMAVIREDNEWTGFEWEDDDAED